jgi:hypothetical protein
MSKWLMQLPVKVIVFTEWAGVIPCSSGCVAPFSGNTCRNIFLRAANRAAKLFVYQNVYLLNPVP